MKRNTGFKEEYLTDWPRRYYSLEPQERLAALQEVLKRTPGSPDDLRRRELFELRYDQDLRDRFLNAWMMLKTADAQPSGFLMKKKFERDVKTEFQKLGISEDGPDEFLLEEWRCFADTLITMYLSSQSYRAAVFGMGSVSDRNTALRLASEIETVTKTVPERASLGALAAPFRNIILERFCTLVPDGEDLLDEVQSR